MRVTESQTCASCIFPIEYIILASCRANERPEKRMQRSFGERWLWTPCFNPLFNFGCLTFPVLVLRYYHRVLWHMRLCDAVPEWLLALLLLRRQPSEPLYH